MFHREGRAHSLQMFQFRACQQKLSGCSQLSRQCSEEGKSQFLGQPGAQLCCLTAPKWGTGTHTWEQTREALAVHFTRKLLWFGFPSQSLGTPPSHSSSASCCALAQERFPFHTAPHPPPIPAPGSSLQRLPSIPPMLPWDPWPKPAHLSNACCMLRGSFAPIYFPFLFRLFFLSCLLFSLRRVIHKLKAPITLVQGAQSRRSSGTICP